MNGSKNRNMINDNILNEVSGGTCDKADKEGVLIADDQNRSMEEKNHGRNEENQH